MGKCTIALCQHKVRDTVEENLKAAAESVKKAAETGAKLVVLPEMFVCHFVPTHMRENTQTLSGGIMEALSRMAKENEIWLVGGSFPEIVQDCDADEKLYNTCPVFSPDGAVAGIYRKRYLFDVDIPGRVRSCESVVFTPGTESLVIDAGFIKFGVAVCFDIRFPQIFIDMAKDGAELVVVPAAFSSRTGPAHWELLNRARAIDAQVYIAGADIAFCADAPFVNYGHSCVTDPWGTIIAAAGEDEEIITARIDTDKIGEIRQSLVVLRHQPNGRDKRGQAES